jgi:hypothetical protein
MAVITSQAASVPGQALTMSSAAGGGDTLTLDPAGNILLVVTAGTITTPTLTTPNAVHGLAVADGGSATSATGLKVFDLPWDLYANTSGQCAVSWSATTNVTFALLRR